MSMFDYNAIMALKEMVGGQEEEQQLINNPYKGSMLNPGNIGENGQKKQVAKPNAKIEAKIGEKYIPKKQKNEQKKNEKKNEQKKQSKSKMIWSAQQVDELPTSKNDTRKQPQFTSLYRQQLNTEDVYLGLSGIDPSSNNCQQILYRIFLPSVQSKDIQLDLSENKMVIQTKEYYLEQYFQYKMNFKLTKAKFITDKHTLQIVLPILRNDDL